ncbi:hypothetical protein Vafri_3412 [Volvox africanus]|uniref:Methyltransferase domain-containing protein n=1 Tax=Volvox africanus TaxID=51714 RepID=A0A8J4AUA1_9CHLO|nr:hypothetical protein Vafri_3412 [Volvox africanus]
MIYNRRHVTLSYRRNGSPCHVFCMAGGPSQYAVPSYRGLIKDGCPVLSRQLPCPSQEEYLQRPHAPSRLTSTPLHFGGYGGWRPVAGATAAATAPVGRTALSISAASSITPAEGCDGCASKGDWRQELIEGMAQAEGFAEMTIRAKVASAQPWHTITVRPLMLRGIRQLQVTTFTARQSTAVNHLLGQGGTAPVEAVVRPLLEAGGLGSVTLRTCFGDLVVQITKRGKGIVHRSEPQSRPALVPSEPGRALAHDRLKDTPIPADQPHPFLQQIGFQTADGRIRANMQDKFSQVNEFLKLLGHTSFIQQLLTDRQQQQHHQQEGRGPHLNGVAAGSSSSDASAVTSPSSPRPRRPLHILDCGCGSSHLSFGTYHYLNHVLGLPASLGGVDVNAALMAKANENARRMGLEGVSFDTAPIGDYRPPVPPDIVLALHACDTATDDALALAVKQDSPLILAVPCCHAHLHKQLAGQPPTSRPPWAPLLRHGILKQRQLDLVTDTLRAQLLRVAGYQTDVVEFTSAEHTPRNLLIRAVRQKQQQRQALLQAEPVTAVDANEAADTGANLTVEVATAATVAAAAAAGPRPSWSRQQLAAAREYVTLRDFWGVTPYLEVLLQEGLGPLLRAAAAQQGSEESVCGRGGSGEAEVKAEGDDGDMNA